MSDNSMLDNFPLPDAEKGNSHVGRLSFFEKVTYAFGGSSEILMANLIFALALPIYNVGLGIDARLIGIAIAIPRLWDAFTDPIMGNISDNTRSRWGRRRPYIFSGAVVTGLLCMILWLPPVQLGNGYVFAFFLTISILYFTAYTVFSVPYNGLGYELTDDYDERTRVMAYKAAIGGFFGTLILPWAYKACFWFGDNEVQGARVVGLIFGSCMIFFGVFPAIFCKERARSKNQEKITFLRSFRLTIKNKPFMMICGVILFVIMGIFIAIPLQFFLNMAYVIPGDKEAAATFIGYTNLTYGIMGFLAVPLISMLSARYGKKATLISGLIFVMTGCLLSWFYYTPKNPYLQIFFGIIIAPGMASIWILTSSCIADVCDVDELATGLRREGIYGAIFTWLMKAGVAGVMALSGFIIAWSGFDRNITIQSEGTILRLRLIFAISPFVLLMVAVFLMCLYPITRQKLIDTQRLLEERKKLSGAIDTE